VRGEPIVSPVVDAYDGRSRERLVPEPPKRVEAPERTPFERDRARVVHAASSRRLAAKTQVMGPQTDDFVRNRLTHSLEVAQVARDLARALGCHPDVTETAALAHDLGHPPFGHNGERALAELSRDIGGFEGNAQTLRLLTRLEAKTFGMVDGAERSVGLNLTRATLDACTKYPWPRAEAADPGGRHADGLDGPERRRRCVEAQVMDLADDVAYSVHDVEDGIVAGRIDLTRLDVDALWETVRQWYLPGADDTALAAALASMQEQGSWPRTSYDASRRGLAAIKNLTSDLIGRFCGSVQAATFAAHGIDEPIARHRADLVVPEETVTEIGILKGIAAHYVMQADERVSLMRRQRELLSDLVEVMDARGADALDPMHTADWLAAPDDAARRRVVVDQVASLTDASAVARHRDLLG
jgi:dGTPase